jgi:methionyl aminopeptidase
VPGERPLRNGDIVNLDITVISDGYHGDSSRMFQVGETSLQARRLCEVSFECLWLGIVQVRAGAHLGDIGHAIQKHAEQSGYSVVREFCGHGIGARFHEEPQVLHYGRPHTGIILEAGMIFTIEPMINAGRAAVKTMADGWTIVTKDHSLSAQWEHTVLVTDSGYEVLTVSSATPPQPDWIGQTPDDHAETDRQSLVEHCRSRLREGQSELRQRFLDNEDAPHLLRARCALVDEVLGDLWQALCPAAGR